MANLIKKVFGDLNERELKKYMKKVNQINDLEPAIQLLSDEELLEKTPEFKTRIEQGETLDQILPEAFAVVREVSKRILGKRHYDVQLIGGMVLHEGRIAEMRTGEGKTLVATLPAYLNALLGKGVHVITANEYLAKRDCEEMGKLYQALGLTVAVNLQGLHPFAKKEAYLADILYGTSNEFGFDYLRDNMVSDKNQAVQRPLHYAVIDEVDSILIDEARTPLIISGTGKKSNDLYAKVDRVVRTLVNKKWFVHDEQTKTVALTDIGMVKAEQMLGVDNIFESQHRILFHHLTQSLKAHVLMRKDVDYVVQDGEILIVDAFTGRTMPGRRYNDGLHQAIEAKENVEIQDETSTFATVTIQNYFRMYQKVSGMTGTGKTEEEEFKKIYGLLVIVVPTNKPMIRKDNPDVVYKTRTAKFHAVIKAIEECNNEGRPVLIGTTSIETSEHLSEMLEAVGIEHQVLNAKYHAEEANIVAQAGQRDAVTIATNMAGRGTDIILGEGVAELGGLHIIGTERHESRRIDNQLRGRAGRQGDPGSSQFFLSMEDELMIRFGSEKVLTMLEKLGFEENDPIQNRFIAKSIEAAQRKVEGSNFDIRKMVLEYDDVMNRQRKIVYQQRDEVLESENVFEGVVSGMIEPYVERIILQCCPADQVPEEWDFETLTSHINDVCLKEKTISKVALWGKGQEEMKAYIANEIRNQLFVEVSNFTEVEKRVVLECVDRKWMEHLEEMEHLRQGIHLRAYGGTDPLRDYQFEGYEIFKETIVAIQDEVVEAIIDFRRNQLTIQVA